MGGGSSDPCRQAVPQGGRHPTGCVSIAAATLSRPFAYLTAPSVLSLPSLEVACKTKWYNKARNPEGGEGGGGGHVGTSEGWAGPGGGIRWWGTAAICPSPSRPRQLSLQSPKAKPASQGHPPDGAAVQPGGRAEENPASQCRARPPPPVPQGKALLWEPHRSQANSSCQRDGPEAPPFRSPHAHGNGSLELLQARREEPGGWRRDLGFPRQNCPELKAFVHTEDGNQPCPC